MPYYYLHLCKISCGTMAMTITTAMASPSRQLLINSQHTTLFTIPKNVTTYPATTAVTYQGLLNLNHSAFSQASLRPLVKPVSASKSGVEASIAAKISVEYEDDEKIQVRVDVNEDDTGITYEKVLTNLAKAAQPIPGFRRDKGGKTSKVPREFLPQILGEDLVTDSVIREIVNSTIGDYVKKENLKVKGNNISITQSEDELRSSFVPGTEFRFNAILELEKSKTEVTT
ncbi:hypothetical protein P3S67_007533 [Capsicum chacoense]|nr:putative serine carboxypeptidase 3-like [Capsicum annuum]